MGSWSVQIVIAMMLGIFLGSVIPSEFAIFLPLCLPLLPVFHLLGFKRIFWRPFLFGFVFCFGIFAFLFANTTALRPAESLSGRYVSVVGRITEIPTQQNEHYTYIIDVPVIFCGDERVSVNERIRFSSETEHQFGDSVIAEGFLEHFDEPKNTGEFNYGYYYKARGIHYRLQKNRKQAISGNGFTPLPSLFG